MAYDSVPQISWPQSTMPFARGYQNDPGFSQWQLDPKDVLELVEHALRGEIWRPDSDGKGGKWVQAEGVKPMLNEAGIQCILKKLTGIVNRVTIMSNLDEKSINSWLWDLGHDLAGELALRVYDWDVDMKDLDNIHDLVMIFTEASLKRALLDGERRKIYEGQQRTEVVNVEKAQGGGGLFSWIPGLGGR